MEAEELARNAFATTLRLEDVTRGQWAASVGHTAFFRGRLREADRWLSEGAAVLKEYWSVTTLSVCLRGRAEAAALRGDIAAAEAALAESRSHPAGAQPVLSALLLRAEAWVEAAKGEVSSAVGLGCRAAEVARKFEIRGVETFALHDVARLGAPERVVGRLEELASSLDGRLFPTCVEHVRALVDGDAAALEVAAGAFESMDALLLAAEAYAEAAAAHRQAGRASSWRAARGRALTLVELCEGARTPALDRLDLLDLPEPLTAREREVAGLAASGMTSPAIAERLVISVRTVENHLQQAYTKLGVRNRSQLAALPGLAPGPPRPS
jgi:ATP/maltotriose-dependent transcriptional regulator MalT